MGRGSRRSFQIQSKDDITEEAKVIRLRTSGRQYLSDDCRLPRYVKVETESTGFPSTRIDGGRGPEPTFWILVFGHEIRRPNTVAACLAETTETGGCLGRWINKEGCHPAMLDLSFPNIKICYNTVSLNYSLNSLTWALIRNSYLQSTQMTILLLKKTL